MLCFKDFESIYRRIKMRLLNESFNEDINFTSFIDELDRFDEIDIDMISKEYEIKFESKINIKNIDETS
jgi:hypothetical protein